MTLGLLALLSVLLGPLLLGAGLVRLLGLPARADPLAFAAWSTLTGGLATAALLFLWTWLQWPLEARWLAPLVAGGGLLALGLAARRAAATGAPPPARPSLAPPWPVWERLFFWLVLALLLESCVARALRASLQAIALGDDATLWTLKARLLFDVGGLSAEYGARTVPYFDSHPDYPLLNPLLQLWAMVHGGSAHLIEARFPIQLFSLALVPALASALRRVLRPGAAALLLLTVQAVNPTAELTRTALSDPLVALALLMAGDAGLRWWRGGEAVWGRLAAVALAFLAGAKNEGAFYALAYVLAFALAWCWPGAHRARAWRPALAWLLLPLVVALAGKALNAHFGFEGDMLGAGTLTTLGTLGPQRLDDVLAFFARLFWANPRENAGLPGALLVLSLLAPARLLRARLRPAALLCWLLCAGWVLIYLCTPHPLEWHLATSAPRLAYHALPLMGLVLALFLAGDPWLGPRLRARKR